MANKINLTPGAVNKYLKSIVERDKYLMNFKIEGEISNMKNHTSGNLYFTIKDPEAAIDCVMFSSFAKNVNFKPDNGMNVILNCAIYLNIKTGKYSLNVREMEQVGIGDLHTQYLKLLNELKIEGLFDQSHKKSISRFPKKIGVITSDTSAAVRDIITTLRRRYPLVNIVIIQTLVQGNGAVKSISDNIIRANEIGDFDCLIVGRGGGSIEDLWAFNSREVAMATFNSKIPIISSVGHETDTTIIDYVSDLRAPTPTAAAELATPDIVDLELTVNSNVKTISKYLTNQINLKKSKLEVLSHSQYLVDPIMAKKLAFDNLDNNFKLVTSSFKNDLNEANFVVSNFNHLMIESINNILNLKKNNLYNNHNVLDQLNPLTILSRGYSVCSVDNKSLVSINQINLGDEIDISLSDGIIKTKVLKKDINE